LLKKTRELEEREKNAALEVERRVAAEFRGIEEKAAKRVAEEYRLKGLEHEKQMNDLAKQTMEDFHVVLGEFKPVIYKTARRTGELAGSSVVIATIQSLMMDGRYREEFTPFYFDLVINDEAHRSIYGDAREVVQFFQATRIGLTATPKAYLKNINPKKLGEENPKALEARELHDTYRYFGCEPGQPTYRYDIIDAVQDPEGPFLCLPKIIDCRSDITTQALQRTLDGQC
jgi:Type I site-specific restriction-modification system, R (restriction) subunit and related helicases